MIYGTSKWKKISNRKTGKYVYLSSQSVKNGVIFFISLRIYLHFHEVQKKNNNSNK